MQARLYRCTPITEPVDRLPPGLYMVARGTEALKVLRITQPTRPDVAARRLKREAGAQRAS